MGHRLRIGRIAKAEHEKYKDLATEEEVSKLAGLEEDEGVYRCLPGFEEIHEIGKYVDYTEGTRPFFAFELEENEFEIASKEWLISLIEDYRNTVSEWYRKAYFGFKVSAKGDISFKDPDVASRVYAHIRSMCAEWGSDGDSVYPMTPYNLEPGGDGPIVSSWKFEYSIFNLVHILHTFDWENDYLIYNGW